jgi:hypothetical protein
MERHNPTSQCGCGSCVLWDRNRLQKLLDSRPANNAGISHTYPEWNQAVYASDIKAVLGSSEH